MINRAPFDRFTLAHLAGGYLMARAGLSFQAAAALAIGWELVERPLKSSASALFPNPVQDSAPNALVDIGAVLVGHIIGAR
jgi:hypothetical protein